MLLSLIFVQVFYVACNSEELKLCLSCPPVNSPHECTAFDEIRANERCSTDLILLRNGSIFYKFGYEPLSYCPPADTPEPGTPARKRRRSDFSISLCHKCCSESLCNNRLCRMPQHKDTGLACLSGENVRGIPLDTNIAYCNEGEQCFVGELPYARPHHFTFQCISTRVCDKLSTVSTGIQKSSACQKCCSQDGCNAHICQKKECESDSDGTTTATTATTTTITTTATTITTPGDIKFSDCWDLYKRGGFREDRSYVIYPSPAHKSIVVRCDMTTDGGGWTILQRRYDGSLNFTRSFQEYEEGFGHAVHEYWLGLKSMHLLTTQPDNSVQLRVDLCTFNGSSGYALYNGFNISARSDTYLVHTGSFMGGTLVDNLSYHDGATFKTTGNCAEYRKSGWWFKSCLHVNLNGGLYDGGHAHGITWRDFYPGHMWAAHIKSSEMKIRPVNAAGDDSRPYVCPHN